MQWKGRRESDRVEDARDESPPMTAGRGGGALLGLLLFVTRRFGIKGILAVILIGGVMWKMGMIDPAMLLSGGPTTNARYLAITLVLTISLAARDAMDRPQCGRVLPR